MNASETSPDVCYRHPDRASWTLCERCGRTICPECQILTPQGVRCPECVTELGGSITWQGANVPVAKQKAAAKRGRGRAKAARERRERGGGDARYTGPEGAGSFGAAVGQMLRPGGETPLLSWGAAAIVIVLWIVGLFATDSLFGLGGGLPFGALSASSAHGIEIWRYATAWAAYPAVLSGGIILSLLLSILFFLLIAPGAERMLGRRRFIAVFLVATIVGSAANVLAVGIYWGFTAPLFGFFGAVLILVWHDPPQRTRVLIMLAINALISLVFGGTFLAAIVGGVIGGGGATFLLRRADDGASTPRAAYLIIGAAAAGFVLIAIIRSLATAGLA